jgi:hypothetical protein
MVFIGVTVCTDSSYLIKVKPFFALVTLVSPRSRTVHTLFNLAIGTDREPFKSLLWLTVLRLNCELHYNEPHNGYNQPSQCTPHESLGEFKP